MIKRLSAPRTCTSKSMEVRDLTFGIELGLVNPDPGLTAHDQSSVLSTVSRPTLRLVR